MTELSTRSRTRSRQALSNISNNELVSTVTKTKTQTILKRSSFRKGKPNQELEQYDVYKNMRFNELRYYRCEDYMTSTLQAHLCHSMRTMLVAWLVEVMEEFKLSSQTLHIAVYILDGFLARHFNVKPCILQLIGITCMFIAAKYEEIHPLDPKDCSYITDYTYTAQQVLSMEQRILVTMQFRISVVTSIEFRHRFQCEHPLVEYLLELTLREPMCLVHKPSELAAAACAYVRAAIGQSIWPSSMQSRTGYTFGALRGLLEEIRNLHWRNFKVPAARYSQLAEILPLASIPSSI
uniref:Cyclin N-terminal domain-containing protein n=1 Tax=Spongospora subterranea TaxID=70186 RepID=A0A0H5QIV6_9EUKA|eukprot:CRZ01928.1 hypothetical protein [Spongospora subterranea]